MNLRDSHHVRIEGVGFARDRINGRQLLMCLGAAAFWAWALVGVNVPYSQALSPENSSGLFLATMLGNLAGLVLLGLAGHLVKDRHLLILGILSAVLGTAMWAFGSRVDLAWAGTGFVARCLIGAGGLALLLVWGEYFASFDPGEKNRLVAATGTLAIALFFLTIEAPATMRTLIELILPLLSGFWLLSARSLPTSSSYKQSGSSVFPWRLRSMYAILGLTVGFLTALRARSDEGIYSTLPAPRYILVFGILALVVAAIFFFSKPRMISGFSAYLSMMLLLAAGLLFAPPLLQGRASAILGAAIAFNVLCQVLVVTIGPPGRRTWRLGKITVTYWERSTPIIGRIVGFSATYAVGMRLQLASHQQTMVAVVLSYTIALLIVLSLPERILVGPRAELGSAIDLPDTCRLLASRYQLTPREEEVLLLLSQGKSVPQIQGLLVIAPGTAAAHMTHVYQKLGVHSRWELLDLVHRCARPTDDESSAL